MYTKHWNNAINWYLKEKKWKVKGRLFKLPLSPSLFRHRNMNTMNLLRYCLANGQALLGHCWIFHLSDRLKCPVHSFILAAQLSCIFFCLLLEKQIRTLSGNNSQCWAFLWRNPVKGILIHNRIMAVYWPGHHNLSEKARQKSVLA